MERHCSPTSVDVDYLDPVLMLWNDTTTHRAPIETMSEAESARF